MERKTDNKKEKEKETARKQTNKLHTGEREQQSKKMIQK